MSEEIKYEATKCQRFNESLDADGNVVIANIPFQRSRILYEIDIETYKQALYEFWEQDYEELKQIIFDAYPACIAYNFRLSERGEGAGDPVRKLLHLKDCWEAIIFVLYALVMGEVRKRGVGLKSVQVFVSHDAGGNPIFANLNTDKILSESLKQKLYNIKAIVEHLKGDWLDDVRCECIEVSLIDDLIQLQDIRNDLSHHNTPTREQAEAELKLVLPIFREMLMKTKFLENCKIFRFDSYSSNCHCESFNGHFLNREFENLTLNEPKRNYVIGLNKEQVFVFWDNEVFSLSPFLHFDKDTTGHESYLCVFKGKRQGKFWNCPVFS